MIKQNIVERVGFKVTSLAFGGASIGNLFKSLTNEEAIGVVEKAIEVGWRHFDTAPHYGAGLSELRLGLGLRGLDRKEYVLSTKVGRLLKSRAHRDGLDAGDFFYDENPFDRVYDYSYSAIMRSYEDSIQRLGTRYIDILYVHDLGTYTHGQTELERKYFKDFKETGHKALEELKKNGDIKAWGVGANEQEILMEVMDCSSPDLFMFANRYNLLEPDRREFFERCKKSQVSVVVAAPFATGVLARVRGNTTYEYGKVPEETFRRVEDIQKICEKYGVPIGAVALQFPLRNERVVAVACGVKSPQQAVSNCEWAKMDIPHALWDDLAELGIKSL